MPNNHRGTPIAGNHTPKPLHVYYGPNPFDASSSGWGADDLGRALPEYGPDRGAPYDTTEYEHTADLDKDFVKTALTYKSKNAKNK
jgi:hypothetical protein